MVKRVRKAVFPVAGLGTRFLPATKAIPKEMLPLADKPLIQHAVDEAKAAGIEMFCFVTSRGKTPLEDHFDLNYELNQTLKNRGKLDLLKVVEDIQIDSGKIAYVRQSEPLGLGHAVWCAREFIGDEPFAVLLPDEQVLGDRPCLAQMMDAYSQVGGNLLSVFEVPREQTNKYGILDIGKDDGRLAEVKGLVEKPDPAAAPSTLSIQGRYILQPEIFHHLERFETGAGGEIQLTDAMAKLIGTQPFHGFRFEGKRFDCGDKLGFVLANVAYALERPDMAAKVRAALKEML
ncbi:UTP--glucose-1-phosphate uridylyltransferase GalU [Nitrospirillum viridazoti]|uniref:UTP--glucose-1-phosphate uridylyltransferase n=1 Tax=Nitrospirillum viridazoti CBAmc TaxID=1441467 RepID=A0A248JQZ3_9PROT|nr:UTP--glucose-1-phosphate uridylyltransferase GalU [Nitrospirillum amazonense]ASG20634.1 UTP--glucose-1-phosphate uridylyltransferase [Nitrospirillum amazonense CBAmc]TWB34262.1 UTP--glucose-1-phosphate uridylyltransferase [Nitrospirillum amazonense]